MTRSGYAFPMALVAVIVIAVVTAAAAEQVRSASGGVIALADAAQEDREAANLEQTLLYQIMAEPADIDGLEIGGVSGQMNLRALGFDLPEAAETRDAPTLLFRADAEPYAAPPAVSSRLIFRLADQEAFLNVGPASPSDLIQAVRLLGASESDAVRLAATLGDYQDMDNRRRLSGAEAAAYDDPDLPPDRALRDPLEACRVAGWADSEFCREPGRLLLLTEARARSALNPRYVSPMFLSVALREPEAAAQARARLQSGAARRFTDIGLPQFDEAEDLFDLTGSIGPAFVIMIHPRDGAPVRRTSLRLTPQGLTSPYEVANRYRMGGGAIARFLEVPESAELVELPDAGAHAGPRERP